jgi:hypothetical protein
MAQPVLQHSEGNFVHCEDTMYDKHTSKDPTKNNDRQFFLNFSLGGLFSYPIGGFLEWGYPQIIQVIRPV